MWPLSILFSCSKLFSVPWLTPLPQPGSQVFDEVVGILEPRTFSCTSLLVKSPCLPSHRLPHGWLIQLARPLVLRLGTLAHTSPCLWFPLIGNRVKFPAKRDSVVLRPVGLLYWPGSPAQPGRLVPYSATLQHSKSLLVCTERFSFISISALLVTVGERVLLIVLEEKNASCVLKLVRR